MLEHLVPSGVSNSPTTPSSLAVVEDDGRSGSILDFDIVVTWHIADDAFRDGELSTCFLQERLGLEEYRYYDAYEESADKSSSAA